LQRIAGSEISIFMVNKKELKNI